jgi:hypothetical protein
MKQGIKSVDISAISIADIMSYPNFKFRNPDFQAIDAEDSVFQLYMMLNRLGTDYVPIVDSDEGN